MSETLPPPVLVEGLDAVLIIRLFPEAAGITDGKSQAMAQGIATAEAGALLESSQYEPIPGAGGGDVPATTPPVNVDVPYVSQTGTTLACTTGNWDGTPTSYAYAWKLDGTAAGTNADTYETSALDIGKSATCTVTATNAAGSTTAPSSNAVTVT